MAPETVFFYMYNLKIFSETMQQNLIKFGRIVPLRYPPQTDSLKNFHQLKNMPSLLKIEHRGQYAIFAIFSSFIEE